MAIRHNLVVAQQAGATVDHLLATGGPTRSVPWRQIIADVTGHHLRAVTSGGAPVGDALLAGAGVGLIADPSETARAVLAVEAEHEPNPACRGIYDHLFDLYRRLYKHLQADFAALAEGQRLALP